MKPASILFDLDGTLTDPAPGIIRCLQYALERVGLAPPSVNDLRWCIGPPLIEALKALVGQSRVAEALDAYRQLYGAEGLYENRVYPGMRELLEALHAEGHSLTLCTAKPAVYAVPIMEHFELACFFSAMHGSELDGTRADKAELLRYILKGDTDAIMVGDRKHDIFGARAVGVPAVGVLWGYGDHEELSAAGANAIVANPEELLKVLSRPLTAWSDPSR